MGQVKTLGDTAWRDFVIDGVPSSGPNHPAKTQIRAFVDEVDSAIADAAVGNLAGAFAKITVGTSTDVSNAAYDNVRILGIKKTIAGPHDVLLPAPDPATPGRTLKVIDLKGDAETNNISVIGHMLGLAAQTYPINTNRGWADMLDDGETWVFIG